MKSYGDCSFGHGFEFELISCLVLEVLCFICDENFSALYSLLSVASFPSSCTDCLAFRPSIDRVLFRFVLELLVVFVASACLSSVV